MTVTTDWQFEFNSLLVGDPTDYGVVSIEGLADVPDMRTSDQPKLQRHGMLPGLDLLGGRSVVVQIEIDAASDSELATLIHDLKLALRPGQDEAALTFQIPGVADGGTRRIVARPRRVALPIDLQRYYYRLPIATVEFFATDPRIYDDSLSDMSTGLAVSVAGRASGNFAWNMNWGGTTTGNIINATNSGTFSTPALIRFNGPVTNPQVENVTAGKFLKLTADGGLTLGVGEFVELDTANRTVLLGGTSNRYSKLSSDSEWWDLEPGVNQLRFIGSTAGSPTMDVEFRSAWA
jgi:hypothetical protein